MNRRNVTGFKRMSLSEEIQKSTLLNIFYEKVSSANKQKFEQGNCTSAPNLNVLRKIISEQIRKEHWHSII